MEQPQRAHLGAALRALGPGLAVAATGVGAGDLLAAMIAGAELGTVLIWAIVVGAALKLALNEGVARWQLATGTSLLEGWCRHLGRPFQVYFMLYLVVWSFVVAGGLMSACGIACHALLPAIPIKTWAVLHSLVALVVVLAGRYSLFEIVMKVLIAVMVTTIMASAAQVGPDLVASLSGLIPRLPPGSAPSVLSLMGGVGGSVTLLSYGYWMREKGWIGVDRLAQARIDLAVGYLLTGLFGVAMLLVAATVLGGGLGGMPAGSAGLVACGDAIAEACTQRFGAIIGGVARPVFLIGVWGAVFTSTLGVWQGVPYLFADFLLAFRGRFGAQVDVKGATYRAYLLYLAIPPMLLLLADRPVWVIRIYTITGGLFMPVLAASLLWLTSRAVLMGRQRSRAISTCALVIALLLFIALAIRELADI